MMSEELRADKMEILPVSSSGSFLCLFLAGPGSSGKYRALLKLKTVAPSLKTNIL
jgi:hypothetical protein